MKTRTAGFTLTEVLLAMTILVLVMGAVFATLQSGLRLYSRGLEMMNVYQSARIALRTMTEELQFALSANNVWKTSTQLHRITVEQAMLSYNGMLVQEEDIAAVRFMGRGNEVIFCRKVYQFGKQPPYDIQECRFFVDNGQLQLEIMRSLTMVNQAVWFYRNTFSTSVNRIIAFQGHQQFNFRVVESFEEPPLELFVGDYGVLGQRLTIADGIKSISFRYSDGQGWKGSWDSERAEAKYRRSPQSPNFNSETDEVLRKTGPPRLVEVQLTLFNDDVLATVIEVPSGAANIGANAVLMAPSQNRQSQQTNTRTTTETPFAVP